jgi:protein regulator of cytokinesis 1
LQKVSGFVKTVHQLCVVLGKDSFSTLAEIHPSLNDSSDAQSKSISDNTLARLDFKVVRLTKDKKRRLRKVC